MFALEVSLLVHHLLRLVDDSRLQRLYLVDQRVDLWVAALQFPPPVHVHRVLQLLRQRLHLVLLAEQLPLQVVLLLLHVEVPLRTRSLDAPLQAADLAPELRLLVLPPLEVRFTLAQSGLLHTQLLVQQIQLVAALDQLRGEDVALPAHGGKLLLLREPLQLRTGNRRLDLLHLAVLQLRDVLELSLPLFRFLEVVLHAVHILGHLHMVAVLFDELPVAISYFVPEVLDLVVHAAKPFLHAPYLLLCLCKVLRVQISVRPNGFVQVLLLVELRLDIDKRLVQVRDSRLP
mmetsp:Transcript_23761/g.60042  ORF Transcript_23761/g.60042 Transcript_23761/m.60042 type:complete len:289 (+) Transcript_23761:946-1812(+)